jgi:hypothetical protein
MSGARQSPGAHALWQGLSRHYAHEVASTTLDDLHTRMFLLGDGWTLARFRRDVRMD